MKSRPSLRLALLAPLLLGPWGCSRAGHARAPSVVDDVKKTAKDVAADVKTAAADSWDAVKDFTYERRAEFQERVDRMAGDLDARVAAAPQAATRNREKALEEFREARVQLKARLSDLSKASEGTWAGAKARVDDAWRRMKVACDEATR